MFIKNKPKRTEQDRGSALNEKRMKVHAQRKFAQGSPSFISHKEKEKDHEKSLPSHPAATAEAVSDLITDICPKTEDFLTFLCFRGTHLASGAMSFFKSVPTTGNGDMKTSGNSTTAGALPKQEKKNDAETKKANEKNNTTTYVKAPHNKKLVSKVKKTTVSAKVTSHIHSNFSRRLGTGMLTRLGRLKRLPPNPKSLRKEEIVRGTKMKTKPINAPGRIGTRSQRQKGESSSSSSETDSSDATESSSESDSESSKSKKPTPRTKEEAIAVRTRRSSAANSSQSGKSTPGSKSASKISKDKVTTTDVKKISNTKLTRQSLRSSPIKTTESSVLSLKSRKSDANSKRNPESEATKALSKKNEVTKTDNKSKKGSTVSKNQTPVSAKAKKSSNNESTNEVNGKKAKSSGATPTNAPNSQSRPTRRTKEAASIYLTIIGHDEELDSSEMEEEAVLNEKKENQIKSKPKTTDPPKKISLGKKRASASPIGVKTRRGASTSSVGSPAAKKRAILREAAKRFTETNSISSSSEDSSSEEETEDESTEDEGTTKKSVSSVRTRSSSLRHSAPSASTFSSSNHKVVELRKTRAASKNQAKATQEVDKKSTTSSRKLDVTPKKQAVQSGATKSSERSHEVSRKKSLPKRIDAPTPPLITSLESLTDAPVFHPTEKEFNDPIEYLEKIAPECERFGICRIVPPSSFKPECEVSDAMRFTAYNQYIHRMFRRKGPNSRQWDAFNRHLTSLNIDCTPFPCIGGIEVDLPGLYQAVEQLGGPMKVLEKNLWPKVADMLKIPRAAQDRLSKLDSIYCKYLLPFATLSDDERKKLMNKVDSDRRTDDDIDCVVKGSSVALNTFYRIARNTMAVWFPSANSSTTDSSGIDPEEVELTYWKLVTERNAHVCVHSGNIDSGQAGYGFPCNKTARHPWNLKVLTNNNGSVLRSIGPVMGATVPTLHVGMLFSASCWYRDPHGLPWIEYLHTGAEKIWYGVPSVQEPVLRQAMTKLVPDLVQTDKSLWLPSDTVMVPPTMLAKEGVTLSRTVQKSGQFIVVWPRAFTASLCTGYTVSESVYFAPVNWLPIGDACFKESQASCEPTVFSMHQLLWSIANDSRSSVDVLKRICPMLQRSIDDELQFRSSLRNFGVNQWDKITATEQRSESKKRRRTSALAAGNNDDTDTECDECRVSLFFSRVECKLPGDSTVVWCLQHALEKIKEKPRHTQNASVFLTHDKDELLQCLQRVQETIRIKGHRRTGGHHRNVTC